MKSNLNCKTVAWISHNQLACGYDDGAFQIYEFESRNRQLNSRMVQKIRHVQGEDDRHGLYIFSPFEFPTLHGKKQSNVMSIIWNGELNLLASGGTNQRVKV
jgi:transducin (beta)-like 1